MKKSITIILAFFLMMNASFATVRTVSNFMGGAQYSDIGLAITASAVGDTLIVYGSPNAYAFSSCTGWYKNLVVYSSGFNAQKQNAYRANFVGDNCNNVGSSFRIDPSGNGTRFYGIEFPNGVRFTESSGTMQNYTFEHCKFNNLVSLEKVGQYTVLSSNNIVFSNCIFDYDLGANLALGNFTTVTTNLLITNCVFETYILGSTSNGSHTVTVDHCVFLYTDNGTPLFFNVYNFLIKNSIFMNNTNLTNGSGHTFQNNMARLFPMTAPNIGNTNPAFVNYTLGSLYSSAHDYNVTNATALTGATDNTQIGVNGGTTKFNESGEVLIAPIVRSLIINNTTIAPSGTINVQINATKPNDN